MRSYRVALRQFSHVSPLDVWYTALDIETLIEMAPDAASKKQDQRAKSDAFDEAVAKFALACADQTERDHNALERAARAGRIKAIDEND